MIEDEDIEKSMRILYVQIAALFEDYLKEHNISKNKFCEMNNLVRQTIDLMLAKHKSCTLKTLIEFLTTLDLQLAVVKKWKD